MGERALIADRWARVHHAGSMGVWPIGASGRTTLGQGENPAASLKPIVCPWAGAPCCVPALVGSRAASSASGHHGRDARKRQTPGASRQRSGPRSPRRRGVPVCAARGGAQPLLPWG